MKIGVATLHKLICDFLFFQEMRGRGDAVEEKEEKE